MLFGDWRVEFVESVSSTQDEVRTRIGCGQDVHGLVLRAKAQTLGRGRRERQWLSGEGGSYQTLALADEQGRFRSGLVAVAVGVGIAGAFSEEDMEVGLKWPNDLYLDSGTANGVLVGKLGGILCEHIARHLLVGVGVNVSNVVPAGAAALLTSHPEQVSEIVLRGIRVGLDLFGEEDLPRLYSRYDLLRGRKLRVSEGERELVGKGAGVTTEGCLQLEAEAGLVSTCNGRVTWVGGP